MQPLTDAKRPFAVTVLGSLVIAFGICTWVDALVGCIGGNTRTKLINPWMLLPRAGYGVLRLRPGWRRFLLVLSWFVLACIGIACARDFRSRLADFEDQQAMGQAPAV